MDKKKIIVAVHGIGDQFKYETIQSVAYRFCSFYHTPTAIPLGSFHARTVGTQGALLLELPPGQVPAKNIGFAEVYWADIPRVPAKEGYTLEEAKKWTKTIVERLRAHCEKISRNLTEKGLTEDDYDMLKRVLEEMIETVAVLERLVFLAEKAGLFKFNLKKLLTDYLGDVQIVTEFEDLRNKILKQFYSVMATIYGSDKDAELYIVAHSEGTVIALLGLLGAMCKQPDLQPPPTGVEPPHFDWVKQVRGFMTIGSPIDKHIILWPDLWRYLKCPEEKPGLTAPIQWWNYYDYGDPIGFDLNTTREWLEDNGWGATFAFTKDHDIGFSRYYFPGKAHVDYWQDADVFDHFIKTVADPPPSIERATNSEQPPPPGSKLWAQVTSYTLPYCLAATLLFVAVYILYKAVGAFVHVDNGPDAWTIFRDVLGITSLLGGMTVTARIPRLTRLWFWRQIGFGLFVVLAIAFCYLVSDGTRQVLGHLIQTHLGIDPTLSILILATVLVVAISFVGGKFPSWGLKPLLILGGLTVFFIVVDYVMTKADKGPVWPVFLAGAGFLYLWWLAALIFDLVFVWHRYIRHSALVNRLRKLASATSQSKAKKRVAV